MALLPSNSPAQDGQSTGFIREVDEALREDEAKAAFHRYMVPAGVGLVAGLLALLGWLLWSNHRADAAASRGETFIQAFDQLDAGNLAQASAKLQPLADSGGDGSQAAARLMQAGIAEKLGKPADAERLYEAVSADSSTPQPYHDLAVIRDTALKFDSLPPAEVVSRLHPLAAPGNPWFGSAGEMTGMAYLKEGRKDLAAPLFGAIAKDATVPDSLRSRARQMAGLLGYDALDDIPGSH